MAKILLTGIATLDIINHVEDYPNEDEEIRASGQQIRRGGNAANSAAILQQYGHDCTLACTLANDSSGRYIVEDLTERGIQHISSMMIDGATPTSYICLSLKNGSRTIVHYRDLAELSYDQFKSLDLTQFDWFHFEARNIEQTTLMIQRVRHYGKPVSLEVEKDRDGLESLLPLADLVLFSKAYANLRSFDDAETFLHQMSSPRDDQILTCSWGDQGAWALEKSRLLHSPAFAPDQVIDTLGAGDTFNAAIIHSLIQAQSIDEALQKACHLAGKKCGQQGFEQLVEA